MNDDKQYVLRSFYVSNTDTDRQTNRHTRTHTSHASYASHTSHFFSCAYDKSHHVLATHGGLGASFEGKLTIFELIPEISRVRPRKLLPACPPFSFLERQWLLKFIHVATSQHLGTHPPQFSKDTRRSKPSPQACNQHILSCDCHSG